jgi:tetratricopeptide (TPR) repeat protein
MRVVRKFGRNMKGFHKSWSCSESLSCRFLQRTFFSFVFALIGVGQAAVFAQQTRPQIDTGVTIQGSVRNSAGKAIGDASVWLKSEGTLKSLEAKTNAAGTFEFTALAPGRYLIGAEKSGQKSDAVVAIASSAGNPKSVDLILDRSVDARSDSHAPLTSANQAMEFSDKPNFTIAGVTDWTAVGGHGSDSALRTSEDLARETLTLKPGGLNRSKPEAAVGAREEKETENRLRAALAESPGSFDQNHQLGEFYLRAARYQDAIPFLQAASRIDPSNDGNTYDLALAYKEAGDFPQARECVQKLLARGSSANLHRLAGEIDEKLGDPLAAVQEEEQAVRLDPTEQNYFAWGSELLLHRAVWQAAEVFKKGTSLYPKSSRMLTALGTSLFAAALYDEAALRLCEASDLDPTNPEPYSFMGKVEREAPMPLACVEPKLARLLEIEPNSALANYLYAMALWKRQELQPDQVVLQKVEKLLTKAVTVDRNCGEAYLQLGILYSSQHRYEQAIGLYKRAIEIDPQSGEAHYRLGVAYDRTGEPAKAKTEFALHDESEKQKAAAVERQRREIKQFLIVLEGQPTHPTAQ